MHPLTNTLANTIAQNAGVEVAESNSPNIPMRMVNLPQETEADGRLTLTLTSVETNGIQHNAVRLRLGNFTQIITEDDYAKYWLKQTLKAHFPKTLELCPHLCHGL